MDMNLGGNERQEGDVARSIERETSKLPSDWFLWAGGAAIVTSLGFMVAGNSKVANFIGQWAPTVLILGLYNKLVKVAGHDQQTTGLH